MKTYDSKLFGKVLKPSTVGELFQVIHSSPLEKSGRTTRIWRGQGDIEWPVDSAAFRRLRINDSAVTENSMRHYEERLLEQATHRGYRQSNGVTLSDFELLARLQHHGAATRLVDASRNALVALWFCVSSKPESTGALFGIHTDDLGGYEGLPETRTYREIMNDCKDKGYPSTWEPPNVTSRVAAQHSQFLYSSISADPRGSLVLSPDPNVSLVIAISKELKTKSVTILQQAFDIHYLTMFPDIDGFGQAHSHRRCRGENYRW